ncbi:quinoprotein dehydrogenase-associated SoxYZ-like carrier [Salinisphaera sp. T31B1]|uniref:quinoprotein dehydrogenase-associated SoxYZ-like carrier n=1 Tax=Salinisphaera sp. T31B1 TaxID=727963 RepID=UPI00334006AF
MIVRVFLIAAVLASPLASAQSSRNADDEAVWKSLRKAYFPNQTIEDGSQLLALDAPYRAEDPAVVPIRITDKLAGEGNRKIDKLWLVIDNNPEPMSAIFEFGPAARSADLATRVRVNSYTYMRVIAKVSDGQLYMVKRYVKASGGCSAPVGRDPEKALEHMGEMRLRQVRMDEGEGSLTQLMIRHPNITGLQMDQLTRLVYPAHFVDAIQVSKGDERVFNSHMTFSLSENPSVQFDVDTDVPGELSAQVEDNKDNVFKQSWPMQANSPSAADHKKSAS